MPGHRGIDLGDQLVILDQLGAIHQRGHQPKIDIPTRKHLGHPRQPLTQGNRIPQPRAGPTTTDPQRRSHLGHHILVPIDGPPEPLGIIVGRPARIQLTNGRQLTGALTVLGPRSGRDGVHHPGVGH
jgi:hypothetical protein